MMEHLIDHDLPATATFDRDLGPTLIGFKGDRCKLYDMFVVSRALEFGFASAHRDLFLTANSDRLPTPWL